MRKIVITGGAGFIGSHVVERVVKEYPAARIDIIDKMTYAADMENVAPILQRGRRHLLVGDICDFEFCVRATQNADCVLHMAAESHVDNSFGNSLNFTRSNTLGTHTLIEACRLNEVKRIIHVSTDEVYGETPDGLSRSEKDILNPTNPYSASKAGADLIVNSYLHSFKLPVVIVRANNIFGTRQYPEKIIPRFIVLGLLGQKFTLHGHGLNRRRYLAAEDFAEAIVLLIQKGIVGEIYHVGSEDEYQNIDVAEMIRSTLGIRHPNVVHVADRLFNDSRYAVNCDKLLSMGWKPQRELPKELERLVAWYRANLYRYAHLFQAIESRESMDSVA